jgi:hypothetical protein
MAYFGYDPAWRGKPTESPTVEESKIVLDNTPTHTKPLIDAPITTNERGGRQSHLSERYDLMPAGPMKALAQILAMGAQRYGEDNWHRIPIKDHVNHAIAHLYEYLDGETAEDHLGHAMCRAMFALYLEQQRTNKLARRRELKARRENNT